MATQIPTFKLYGDQFDWPTPDLLHWESIASRSRLHQWSIQAHRHYNLFQLLYIHSGNATVNLDGNVYHVDSSSLVVIPPLSVHSFDFSPDVDGHVLTLASPLIAALASSLGSHRELMHSSQVIEDPNHELLPLLTSIAQEYRGHEAYRDWALENLVSQIIIWVARHRVNAISVVQRRNKSRAHFSRFQQLIELHYAEHLPLTVYAEELGISLAHLNSICRQYGNRSALQILHERLLLEAKRNLIYTTLSISEIADSLGFSEPAYFTRFFKRLTGCSPQQFRLKP